MANLEHQDHQAVLLNPCDNPPIPEPVAPQPGHVADQTVTSLPGIVERGDLIQSAKDALRIFGIELVELLVRPPLKLNSPSQTGASHR